MLTFFEERRRHNNELYRVRSVYLLGVLVWRRWEQLTTADAAPPGMPRLFGLTPELLAEKQRKPVTITRRQHLEQTAPAVKIGEPSSSALTFRLANGFRMTFAGTAGDWLRCSSDVGERTHYTMVKLDEIHPDDRERVQTFLANQPGTEWRNP